MWKTVIQITILGVLLQVCCVKAFTRMEKEQEILGSILNPAKYNPSIRPSGNGSGPVNVRVNMYMRSLEDIDDLHMEYSLQVTFRQSWNDERLSYRSHPEMRYLTIDNPERIWKPDTFFSNEKEGHFHNILMPNTLLRIFPDGQVLYSIRLSLKLSCPMNLKYYPMDSQTCNIILASYAYTTEDIVFLWKTEDPIQLARNFHTAHFDLEKFYTDYCRSKTVTGEYSCIKVGFLFSRNFSYYFSEIYMPTIILVVISWICFWLDQKATVARVFIWMTTFLVFSLKVACFSSKVPVVSYHKAYDTWIITCLLFLTAVILEVGAVAAFLSREERTNASDKGPGENDCIKKRDSDENEEVPQHQPNPVLRIYRILLGRYQSPQQKIDFVCRILFPLCFALFNLFYWCSTTRKSED